MSSGLAALAKNLEKEKCVNLSKFYKGERLDLLLRKGVYPYDYMDCLDKLKETKLPPIEEFYSKLYEEDISEGDYEHAKNVWKTFRMKTMRKYHNPILEDGRSLAIGYFRELQGRLSRKLWVGPSVVLHLTRFGLERSSKID